MPQQILVFGRQDHHTVQATTYPHAPGLDPHSSPWPCCGPALTNASRLSPTACTANRSGWRSQPASPDSSHVTRRHTAMCKAQQFKGSMQALPPVFWRQTMGTASTMCLAWAQRPCSRARTSAGALRWRVFACRPQRGSVSAKLGRCASLACRRTKAGCASCQAQSAKRKSR